LAAAQRNADKYLLSNVQPSARFVGELALKMPRPVDVAYFEPQYIKPFYTPQK
jgi:hypothetical protein